MVKYKERTVRAMIINTGMRTDIPAFYSQWFVNRIRAGFVLVRNPYRPDWITRYELDPDVVDCIAFCTKNPGPMLKHLDELNAYHQYWFVTITPYGRDIEPNVPPKETVMQDFITLSDKVGINCVGWRYDPILIDRTYTIERHIADFEQMCRTLSGHTKVCVISFIDLYEKVKRNFPQARSVTPQERITIGRTFAEVGKQYGITIKSCAEGNDLAPYGVDCTGCTTQQTFETAIGSNLVVPKKKSQRAECACVLGTDIGAYDTCGHLCRYCYANYNHENVRRNMQLHDPESPFLVGNLQEGEIIHQASQESWIDMQLSFF
ncbi:DUF1848 domain-containing protein [Ruminococcus flavefaciens]|uniref:DUF1848 domain-containing protein n=1 Tax=Ruminococcus flavefaciens TaxID=1265 RepID=UPI00345BA30F